MKKIFAIAAMTSVVLVGCQKNEVTDLDSSKSGYVSFDAYAGKTTRAALTTNANFDVFTVYGYQSANATDAIDWLNPMGLMTDLAVNKGAGNKWVTESPIKWPTEGTKTQFFAYSPKAVATYSIADSKPQLAFTAPTVVADQNDLIVSKSAVVAAPAASVPASVPLNFSHALSKISTKVNASSGLKVYVESIELCNLGSVATYSFDPAGTNSWNAATTPTKFGITLGANAAAGIESANFVDITAADGAALVIPQSTTAWADIATDGKFSNTTKSFIKISYKLQSITDNSYIVGDAGSYVTAYFPAAFSFVSNKAYSYNITFGSTGGGTGGGGLDDNGDPIIKGDALITFDVTLGEWDPTDDVPAVL